MYSKRSEKIAEQFKERCKELPAEKKAIHRMTDLIGKQHFRLLSVTEEEANRKVAEQEQENKKKIV